MRARLLLRSESEGKTRGGDAFRNINAAPVPSQAPTANQQTQLPVSLQPPAQRPTIHPFGPALEVTGTWPDASVSHRVSHSVSDDEAAVPPRPASAGPVHRLAVSDHAPLQRSYSGASFFCVCCRHAPGNSTGMQGQALTEYAWM